MNADDWIGWRCRRCQRDMPGALLGGPKGGPPCCPGCGHGDYAPLTLRERPDWDPRARLPEAGVSVHRPASEALTPPPPARPRPRPEVPAARSAPPVDAEALLVEALNWAHSVGVRGLPADMAPVARHVLHQLRGGPR